jgi:hypothetical protein
MNKGEIIIYQTPNGETQLDVRLENETVWLTQAQMVTLFERDQSVISKHINNIFKEGELDKNVVYANFAYTTKHVRSIFAEGELQEIVVCANFAHTTHLGNIFKSGELEENSVCSKMEHTAVDGKKYKTRFYNLDAILSVGYPIPKIIERCLIFKLDSKEIILCEGTIDFSYLRQCNARRRTTDTEIRWP